MSSCVFQYLLVSYWWQVFVSSYVCAQLKSTQFNQNYSYLPTVQKVYLLAVVDLQVRQFCRWKPLSKSTISCITWDFWDGHDKYERTTWCNDDDGDIIIKGNDWFFNFPVAALFTSW